MTRFDVPDTDFETRVRESFAMQKVMQKFGARLQHVGPGEAVIALPYQNDFTQQHGFLHAGVISAIADSACGYAAATLMPAESDVLAVEFKINFLSPAKGEAFEARVRVVRPGRTITVCRSHVFALARDGEKQIATMLSTIMCVRNRPDLLVPTNVPEDP